MNSRLIFIIAAVVLVLVLAIAAVFFFSSQQNATSHISTNMPFGTSSILPVGGNVTTSVSNAVSPKSVSDFAKQPDVSLSPGGNSFYMGYSNTKASSTPQYEVDYIPSSKSFIIGILQEPIGEIRKKAQADLEQRLGISDAELCKLSTQVLVPQWVNSFYAIKNLGFPGCPGATALPGD